MAGRLKIKSISPDKKHFYLVSIIIAVVMLFLASGAAINIDEILHYNHAKKVVNWFATMGSDTSSLSTPVSNLKYYGQLPDNISALINRVFSIDNEYHTRHYVGFVFAFLFVFITGLLAIEITGSYSVGILAVILVFISPRIMGQAYGNLKDIPFAMGYVWSLLLMIRFVKSMPIPAWKNVILLGLAIAFTNSVRIGGLVFFPYFGLFIIVWLLIYYKDHLKIIKTLNFWKTLILKGIVVVLIGYFLSLIFWPFGLINPIKNPVESLFLMEHYKISIKQIFEGDQLWSTNLPWYYLVKWMLISIPEVVLLGFVLFIGFLLFYLKKENRNTLFQYGMVFFAFVFPLVYVIAIGSNLYSGWRQMYFIYAPFVILASIGIKEIFYRLAGLSLFLFSGFLLILAILPLTHIIKTYPSEYIYFNNLKHISEEPWSNYEYDYYWHEMNKAAEWLADDIKDQSGKITVASNFDVTKYLYDNKNLDFEYIHFYDKISVEWDYAILGVNYVHPYQLKNNTWLPENVVKTFYHNGNPTIVIIKGQDNNARMGYSAFMDKNYELAIDQLYRAYEKDSTDLNILAYLGESYLAMNMYNEVEEVINTGSTKHPFYEPFLLLSAKSSIKQNSHKEALRQLKVLIKENPRYFKALPYLIECYEETGEQKIAQKLKEKYNVKSK